MTSEFVDAAPAKINLTLKVHGRRPDGYHEIESLVAFATAGDRVHVSVPTGDTRHWTPRAICVEGTYAARLEGENLIDRARALLGEQFPSFKSWLSALDITLEKHLPVAAGIGGGSADAAAFLRLMRRLIQPRGVDWLAIAAKLGADVPVCLNARTAIIAGTGTTLRSSPVLPPFPILLVNANAPPMMPKTPRVFAALQAPPSQAQVPTSLGLPWPQYAAGWLEFLEARRNDLEPAACQLMPEIPPVLAALRALPGARVARLSGAGPTCFALFDVDDPRIHAAAAALRSSYPGWWIMPAKTMAL